VDVSKIRQQDTFDRSLFSGNDIAWLVTWHPHSSFVHQYNAKTKNVKNVRRYRDSRSAKYREIK